MQQQETQVLAAVKKNSSYQNATGLLQFDVNDQLKGKKYICCEGPIGAPLVDPYTKKAQLVSESTENADILRIKLKILFNPTSGGGNCLKVVQQFEKMLKECNREYELIRSESLQHFESVVKAFAREQHTKTYQLTIIGGDGSILNALNMLREEIRPVIATNQQILNKNPSECRLLCLPGGTANDFMRTIGLETDKIQNYERILKQPQLRRIDCISLKMYQGGTDNSPLQKYFLTQCGFGFSGRVNLQATQAPYKYFGQRKYQIAAARELFRMKADLLNIEVDGKSYGTPISTVFVSINNGPIVGKYFRLAPYAQLDDGIMDLLVFVSKTFFAAKELFDMCQEGGRHIYHADNIYIRGRNIRVSSQNKEIIALEVDGEDYLAHSIELEVVSDFLTLIC